MSWLNLNDSLNSLKGQISNFANNVLADEDNRTAPSGSKGEVEELKKICDKQQEEITYLKQLNAELTGGRDLSVLPNNGFTNPKEPWSWEVSDVSTTERDNSDEIIANLKKTILELQNEKQELTSNLELLDSEHQLSNEKLINMKIELQKEYNELEDKYNQLELENENLKKNKVKFERIKEKIDATQNGETHSNEPCTRCQKLTAEIEKQKNEISVLKSNTITLRKVLDDTKSANDAESGELLEKLQLFESENKILVAELKKANEAISSFEKKSEIDAENCRKLAVILEGYESQVSALKQELATKESESAESLTKLKRDVDKSQEQLQQIVLEKEQTHSKYINILTENMKRYIDGDKVYEEAKIEKELDPQVLEFNHQVKSILNILLDVKSKCESLEKDLYTVTEDKTNILSEKNHEIEKLIQNSEILSQEVITKSQTIKDYENEINELIKNNDILINELKIFKNNSGLQTISESNEDNMLLLESQLETANKRINELESFIQNNKKEELASDEINEKYVDKSSYEKLLDDFNDLSTQNLSLKTEIEKFGETQASVEDENEHLSLTLEKMKTDLENTEYQYTELNINMEVLKEEIENQKRKIEQLLEQKTSLEKINVELERSNEDMRGELNIIREKLLLEEDNRKQSENNVRNLTEKLQNAKMCETSLKLQYDTINRELSSVVEAKCMLESSLKKTLSDLEQCREDLHNAKIDNEKLEITITEMKNNNDKNVAELEEFQSVSLTDNADLKVQFDELQLLHDSIIEERDNLKTEVDKLNSLLSEHSNCEQKIHGLEKQIEELTATKNELTNVIITKHQESVTYHNEIQRLTQILNTEVEKNRNLESQLETLKNTTTDNNELQKKNEEFEKLSDQNNFLRHKCEVMAQNLLEEQSRVQKILSEQSNSSEKELALSKKLERLQSHLIEVEEHYTQELLRAEERNTELQAKVNEIEQREKNSSTMYTSVSIRANQQVETLQHQLQLITNQRDDLRKKISDAEDHASKQEAALANLQFVLEQFQKDKEKDVQSETERIRRQILAEKKVQEDLRKEIMGLQSQLEESKHGLLAASRLSDQLEQSKQLITTLKTEVSQLKDKLQKNEEQLHNMSSQADGKVDKSLIKNLVLGFVSTNNNFTKDQTQILKIIATVLDFNQQDHDKVNLNKPQQGWLSSFLSPQASHGISQESLSQAFVKFLENESKPRLVPSLLSGNETPTSRKNSTSVPARQSPSILSEVVLPTFADFAQNRNSSSILKDVLKDNS